MGCDEVREQIEAYAIGALDADVEARVGEHLRACTACARLAQEYAAVANALPGVLAATSPLRLPEAIKSRLLTALEAGAEGAGHTNGNDRQTIAAAPHPPVLSHAQPSA